MPIFVYDSDEPRTYHDHGPVERGSEVTADEAPDGRWAEADAKTAPKPADRKADAGTAAPETSDQKD